MHFIFTDLNDEWVRHMQTLLKNRTDCQFIVGDVKDRLEDHTVFVSASNSLLFADAGLDRVYSRHLFPGSEKAMKSLLPFIGKINLVGKRYLPIGDALMINVSSMLDKSKMHDSPDESTDWLHIYLIACPTMLLPQNVKDTRNAYHSALAALKAAHAHPQIKRVVFSGMCCGWGKMAALDSARQMRHALLDFEAGVANGDIIKSQDKDALLYRSRFEPLPEQPDFYENTEWKHDITRVTTDRN